MKVMKLEKRLFPLVLSYKEFFFAAPFPNGAV